MAKREGLMLPNGLLLFRVHPTIPAENSCLIRPRIFEGVEFNVFFRGKAQIYMEVLTTSKDPVLTPSVAPVEMIVNIGITSLFRKNKERTISFSGARVDYTAHKLLSVKSAQEAWDMLRPYRDILGRFEVS